jgi:peptidoglycan/xylan/chitin deacetylase (PgdA/CDA1 family)
VRTAVLVLALAAVPGFATAQSTGKQIAVTFDDLPLSTGGVPASTLQRVNRQLLDVLSANEVPVIGFVNEVKLDGDGGRAARIKALEMWLDARAELGNHSFSHPSLHHTPLDEFEDDVRRGALVTNQLLAARGRAPASYFRHPFLRTGLTLEVKRAFETFLEDEGYTVAPVTIENWDWMFSAVYVNAMSEGDTTLAERTASAYLEFTEEVFEFHERVSRELFDRQIRHVFLVHANELNARYLSAVIDLIRGRGYDFVSLAHALEDDAYASPDYYAGPAGVSWMFRWDYSTGRNVDWRAEPEAPAFIQTAYESSLR